MAETELEGVKRREVLNLLGQNKPLIDILMEQVQSTIELDRLNLLIEVISSISSTVQLEELLDRIIAIAANVMKAEASSLALIDSSTNELVFHITRGEKGDKMQDFRLPVGQGIAGWVAAYGAPLIVPDVTKDPRFASHVDEETEFVTRSIICVPLIRKDKVIGILEVLNKKDNSPFDENDLRIFTSLANIATIAIENAQLYEVLRQKLEQLERANQQLEGILRQLEESEQKVYELQAIQGEEGAIEGKLGAFRVENLLQVINGDFKTGRLILKVAKGVGGVVFFDKGKVTHAVTMPERVEGNEALYRMISWQNGRFSFEDGDFEHPNTVTGSLMSLIIEGLRRFDEAKKAETEALARAEEEQSTASL